jgi:hypothetical protein
MKTRLEAFALAGALALTVVTGGIAFAGLGHRSAAHAPAPAVTQVVPVAAAPAAPHEEGDS